MSVSLHFDNSGLELKLTQTTINVPNKLDPDNMLICMLSEVLEKFNQRHSKAPDQYPRKYDLGEYEHIINASIPVMLASVNGTGYAYEDIHYRIKYVTDDVSECIVTGDTSQRFENFWIQGDSRNNSAYIYPSKGVDFVILNGDCQSMDCDLFFCIKR